MHPSHSRLTRLFLRHNPVLLRYLRRLARSQAIAEDVAQHAWVKLLEHAERGSQLPVDDGELCALLFTVARNGFIDMFRRGHYESRTLRIAPADLERVAQDGGSWADPRASLSATHLHRMVQEAVDLLPPAQRQAVTMWQEGATIREMSRRAGAPRDTVLSRKKYAFAKLRSHFEGCGMSAELALG